MGLNNTKSKNFSIIEISCIGNIPNIRINELRKHYLKLNFPEVLEKNKYRVYGCFASKEKLDLSMDNDLALICGPSEYNNLVNKNEMIILATETFVKKRTFNQMSFDINNSIMEDKTKIPLFYGFNMMVIGEFDNNEFGDNNSLNRLFKDKYGNITKKSIKIILSSMGANLNTKINPDIIITGWKDKSGNILKKNSKKIKNKMSDKTELMELRTTQKILF